MNSYGFSSQALPKLLGLEISKQQDNYIDKALADGNMTDNQAKYFSKFMQSEKELRDMTISLDSRMSKIRDKGSTTGDNVSSFLNSSLAKTAFPMPRSQETIKTSGVINKPKPLPFSTMTNYDSIAKSDYDLENFRILSNEANGFVRRDAPRPTTAWSVPTTDPAFSQQATSHEPNVQATSSWGQGTYFNNKLDDADTRFLDIMSKYNSCSENQINKGDNGVPNTSERSPIEADQSLTETPKSVDTVNAYRNTNSQACTEDAPSPAKVVRSTLKPGPKVNSCGNQKRLDLKNFVGRTLRAEDKRQWTLANGSRVTRIKTDPRSNLARNRHARCSSLEEPKTQKLDLPRKSRRSRSASAAKARTWSNSPYETTCTNSNCSPVTIQDFAVLACELNRIRSKVKRPRVIRRKAATPRKDATLCGVPDTTDVRPLPDTRGSLNERQTKALNAFLADMTKAEGKVLMETVASILRKRLVGGKAARCAGGGVGVGACQRPVDWCRDASPTHYESPCQTCCRYHERPAYCRHNSSDTSSDTSYFDKIWPGCSQIVSPTLCSPDACVWNVDCRDCCHLNNGDEPVTKTKGNCRKRSKSKRRGVTPESARSQGKFCGACKMTKPMKGQNGKAVSYQENVRGRSPVTRSVPATARQRMSSTPAEKEPRLKSKMNENLAGKSPHGPCNAEDSTCPLFQGGRSKKTSLFYSARGSGILKRGKDRQLNNIAGSVSVTTQTDDPRVRTPTPSPPAMQLCSVPANRRSTGCREEVLGNDEESAKDSISDVSHTVALTKDYHSAAMHSDKTSDEGETRAPGPSAFQRVSRGEGKGTIDKRDVCEDTSRHDDSSTDTSGKKSPAGHYPKASNTPPNETTRGMDALKQEMMLHINMDTKYLLDRANKKMKRVELILDSMSNTPIAAKSRSASQVGCDLEGSTEEWACTSRDFPTIPDDAHTSPDSAQKQQQNMSCPRQRKKRAEQRQTFTKQNIPCPQETKSCPLEVMSNPQKIVPCAEQIMSCPLEIVSYPQQTIPCPQETTQCHQKTVSCHQKTMSCPPRENQTLVSLPGEKEDNGGHVVIEIYNTAEETLSVQTSNRRPTKSTRFPTEQLPDGDSSPVFSPQPVDRPTKRTKRGRNPYALDYVAAVPMAGMPTIISSTKLLTRSSSFFSQPTNLQTTSSVSLASSTADSSILSTPSSAMLEVERAFSRRGEGEGRTPIAKMDKETSCALGTVASPLSSTGKGKTGTGIQATVEVNPKSTQTSFTNSRSPDRSRSTQTRDLRQQIKPWSNSPIRKLKSPSTIHLRSVPRSPPYSSPTNPGLRPARSPIVREPVPLKGWPQGGLAKNVIIRHRIRSRSRSRSRSTSNERNTAGGFHGVKHARNVPSWTTQQAAISSRKPQAKRSKTTKTAKKPPPFRF